MRFALLTASTAALLLSSTAILAQEAAPDLDNVYVDVEGAAVQVSVALAAQACGLEEAAVRGAAATRLEESGPDATGMQAAGTEAGSATTSAPDVQDGVADQGEGQAAAEAGGEVAPAGDTSGDANVASTNDGANLTPTLEGAEATAADDTAAVPDASNDTVTTAQGTADPSTATPGDEMLALAVCQIDVQTATDLGIPQANEIVTD